MKNTSFLQEMQYVAAEQGQARGCRTRSGTHCCMWHRGSVCDGTQHGECHHAAWCPTWQRAPPQLSPLKGRETHPHVVALCPPCRDACNASAPCVSNHDDAQALLWFPCGRIACVPTFRERVTTRWVMNFELWVMNYSRFAAIENWVINNSIIHNCS